MQGRRVVEWLAQHRTWVLEAVALLVVLGTAAFQLAMFSDITFADEAHYMQRGLALSRGVESYSAVYAVAHLFSRDLVTIYFVGRCLGVVVMVLGVWIAGRLLGSPLTALLGALLLVALGSPYVWPGVATFAAGLTIVSVAILLRLPDWRGASVASVMLWLSASSRPEFWPAAALCTALALWKIRIGAREGNLGGAAVTSLVTVIVIVPLSLIGFGSVDMGSSRLWLAFGQHYALAHLQSGDEPWLGWERVLRRDFGDASSIGAAFRASPRAFLAHIRDNGLGIHRALWSSLTWARNTIAGLVPSNLAAIALLSALVALGLRLGVRQTRRSGMRTALGRALQPHTWPIWAIAILSIPPLLVLYPRIHYLQPWVAGFVLIAVVTASRLRGGPRTAAVVLTIALVAVPLALSVVDGLARPLYRENLRVVRELQRLPGEPVVASTLTELDIYIPGVRVVAPRPTDQSFASFLDREHVSVIVADSGVQAGAWSALPDLGTFDPESAGFRPLSTEPPLILLRETAAAR